MFWGFCTVALLPGQRGQTKPHPAEVKTHTAALYSIGTHTLLLLKWIKRTVLLCVCVCVFRRRSLEYVPAVGIEGAPLWQMWTESRFSRSFWDMHELNKNTLHYKPLCIMLVGPYEVCRNVSTGCESDTQFRYFHPDFSGLLYISNMWKNKLKWSVIMLVLRLEN